MNNAHAQFKTNSGRALLLQPGVRWLGRPANIAPLHRESGADMRAERGTENRSTQPFSLGRDTSANYNFCLLYTSDAADE